MGETNQRTPVVREEGRLEIQSPELHCGRTAEATIAVREALTPDQRLALLGELQRSMALTEESAKEWVNQIREERNSNVRPFRK